MLVGAGAVKRTNAHSDTLDFNELQHLAATAVLQLLHPTPPGRRSCSHCGAKPTRQQRATGEPRRGITQPAADVRNRFRKIASFHQKTGRSLWQKPYKQQMVTSNGP